VTRHRKPDHQPGVELVLEHLKEVRAFDFTGYKRATLGRRIEKRMLEVGVADHESYVEYLEVHPDEFVPLFNTLLINVTSFFRDGDVWEVLRNHSVPDILSRKPDGPIRIWSAGCSTGQEAFSAVMLFAEALGVERTAERLKVYATDIDHEALEQARLAHFGRREVASLPEDLVRKYFEPTPAGEILMPDLRRCVIFGRHDLLVDAPISRVDLLLCRNTLMYFNAEAQGHVVDRLHFSLADGGFLMLGKVEMLLGHNDLFEPIDPKRRVFRKRNVPRSHGRRVALASESPEQPTSTSTDQLLDLAFEHAANAQLILDERDLLVAVNARARTDFAIPPDAIGQPFQDLEISYRPIELRSAVESARAQGGAIKIGNVARWTVSGELSYLDVTVSPLFGDAGATSIAVSFADVTTHRQLQDELEQTHRELEVAYEELQSTNEELETTNEELQSAVEELETTNEELQSTNEELETMNEELASTNEELHAINEELQDRTAQIDQINAYLESVLTSIDAAVIVVDNDLRVRFWNSRSFDMWGLRSEEVEGMPLMGIDIGFPVDQLRNPLLSTVRERQSAETVQAQARTRRGYLVNCTAAVRPLLNAAGEIGGAIVLISESAAALEDH
jgi:two-component system, chemotaxis family, CheB/CheR fusion protein